MNNTEFLGGRFPAEIKEKLRSLSIEEDKTLNQLMEEALNQFLQNKGEKGAVFQSSHPELEEIEDFISEEEELRSWEEKLIQKLQEDNPGLKTKEDLYQFLIGKKLIEVGRSNWLSPDREMVAVGEEILHRLKE